jgi:hypothetical protein
VFQAIGEAPFVGTGTAGEAANYARSINHHRTDHAITVRPVTAEEATALAAAHGAPAIFNIAVEMSRLHGSARGYH